MEVGAPGVVAGVAEIGAVAVPAAEPFIALSSTE